MLSVPGSRARKSRISPSSTSEPSPVEITVEKPTRRVCAQSRIAAQIAPDCETSARRPGQRRSRPAGRVQPAGRCGSPRGWSARGSAGRGAAPARAARPRARGPSAPSSPNPAETITARRHAERAAVLDDARHRRRRRHDHREVRRRRQLGARCDARPAPPPIRGEGSRSAPGPRTRTRRGCAARRRRASRGCRWPRPGRPRRAAAAWRCVGRSWVAAARDGR